MKWSSLNIERENMSQRFSCISFLIKPFCFTVKKTIKNIFSCIQLHRDAFQLVKYDGGSKRSILRK